MGRTSHSTPKRSTAPASGSAWIAVVVILWALGVTAASADCPANTWPRDLYTGPGGGMSTGPGGGLYTGLNRLAQGVVHRRVRPSRRTKAFKDGVDGKTTDTKNIDRGILVVPPTIRPNTNPMIGGRADAPSPQAVRGSAPPTATESIPIRNAPMTYPTLFMRGVFIAVSSGPAPSHSYHLLESQ